MKNVLKIEAFSGASGDMFLGALAGLNDSYDDLASIPSLLNFEDSAKIEITETNKNGIVCKQVKVKELKHEHAHRHLSHINKIIDESLLSDNAKEIAREIFLIIGKAESEVHGVSLEKIHFHEVGAVDSIIDVCGVAFLLDKLNIKKTYSSPLTTGKGFVKTAHGMLPVPCPATKLILEGMPTITGDEDGERLTPTGAAIIKYLNPVFEIPATIDIKTSYGSGEKKFITPNVLRLSLCSLDKKDSSIIEIKTNLDDYNPEHLGNEFQNGLLESGAVDFYFTQVTMKKGRLGIVLSAFCKEENLNQVSDYLLNNTTAIGLRYTHWDRHELQREFQEVETKFGKFSVKISKNPNGTLKSKPESDEVISASIEKQVDIKSIEAEIIKKLKL